MKRFIYSIAMLAAMFTAASCVQEEAPVVNNEESKDAVVFSATFSEAPASKATLTEGVESSTVAWEENDEVIIFDGTDWYDYVATPDTEKTKNATLSPKEESASVAGKYHALFLHPAGAEATIDGDVITTTLPAVQVAEPNTFATHLAVAKSNGTSFAFKNVCGLVRVVISTTDVKSVVLEGLNDEVVAGGIKIHVSDEPTWEVDGTNGSKTVTLKAESDATAIAPGVYFFAVLPQTFENGFKVTINRAAGDPVERTTADGVTVERCQIVKGSANSVLGAGTEANPYVLNTAEDMCQMKALATRGQMTYFKLGADIDMTGVTSWETINGVSPYDRYIHFDGAKNADAETKDDCYTISNFAPATITGGWPSFFGVFNGTIQNVVFDTPKINNMSNHASGVIGGSMGAVGGDKLGANPETIVVKNVHVVGCDISSSAPYIGGIFGRTNLHLDMLNCSVSGNLNGVYGVGGVIGYNAVANDKSSTIKGTSFSGALTTTTSSSYDYSNTGGLVGETRYTKYDNCHTSGTISTDKHRVGGLIGGATYSVSAAAQEVKNCTSSMTITSTGNLVGGLIGYVHGADGQYQQNVENCSTTGAVKGASNVGGLVGQYSSTGNLTNLRHTVGLVNGGTSVGGIVGRGTGNFVKCSVESNITATGNNAAGMIGFTDAAVTVTKCQFKGSISTTNRHVGGMVGRDSKGSTISHCYVEGTLNSTQSDTYVGGIMPYGESTAIINISYCFTNVALSGQNLVGGIMAQSKVKTTLDNCIAWGTCTANKQAGLIMAVAPAASLFTTSNCYRNPGNDISNATLYSGYNGEPTAAGKTPSQVAKDLSWDETIWDLTGDVPVLK